TAGCRQTNRIGWKRRTDLVCRRKTDFVCSCSFSRSVRVATIHPLDSLHVGVQGHGIFHSRSGVDLADSQSEQTARVALTESCQDVDSPEVQTKSTNGTHSSSRHRFISCRRKMQISVRENPPIAPAPYNSLMKRSTSWSCRRAPRPIRSLLFLSNVNNSSLEYVVSVLVGFLEVFTVKV